MIPRTIDVLPVNAADRQCGPLRDYSRYPTGKRDKRIIIWDVVRQKGPELLCSLKAAAPEHQLRPALVQAITELVSST